MNKEKAAAAKALFMEGYNCFGGGSRRMG